MHHILHRNLHLVVGSIEMAVLGYWAEAVRTEVVQTVPFVVVEVFLVLALVLLHRHLVVPLVTVVAYKWVVVAYVAVVVVVV